MTTSIATIGLVAGCAPGDHLDGKWTGVITAVTVQDQLGRTYEVVGLQIEKGPSWVKALDHYPVSVREEGRVRPELGGGSLPILTRRDDLHHFALPIAEMPRGSRVVVSGTMYISYAEFPTFTRVDHLEKPGNQISRSVKVDKTTVRTNLQDEHIIIMSESCAASLSR